MCLWWGSALRKEFLSLGKAAVSKSRDKSELMTLILISELVGGFCDMRGECKDVVVCNGLRV